MISADALEAYFEVQDISLSRTALTGTVDASVSDRKSVPNLSQTALLANLTRNRRNVAQYVLSRAVRPPIAFGDFFASVLAIAEIYSADVFDSSLFRLWPYDYRRFNPDSQLPAVEATQIVPALLALDGAVLSRIQNSETSTLAGEVEWEIVFGPIHPFYDSCGRIGRYASTLVALWIGSSLIVHKSRPTYLAAGSRGRQNFIEYLVAQDCILVI